MVRVGVAASREWSDSENESKSELRAKRFGKRKSERVESEATWEAKVGASRE